jgi:hypothetical protein
VECQDGEASASVHGVECFLRVDEDPEEWRLLQMRELLSEFRFDYPGPRAPPCKAPMQAVMEFDGLQAEIHHSLQNLPNRF